MEPVGVLDVLRRVFTLGDAENTHKDIVVYLDRCRIKESIYSKWGRNAFQPSVSGKTATASKLNK